MEQAGNHKSFAAWNGYFVVSKTIWKIKTENPFFEGGTKMETEKVYAMPFAKIYPMLVKKAVRKERTQAEVDEIIGWLTGYSVPQIEAAVQNGTLYGDFFRDAPQLNPDRVLIKGSICGVKLESIEEPLMKEIRYLDKLVDELVKGKAMEKIKRTNK